MIIIDAVDAEETTSDSVSRRTLLTRAAPVGLGASAALGVSALGLSAPDEASTTPQQPEAESGHDYPMPKPNAKTEKDFRMGVIGPATLSLAASQIAVDKATSAEAKDFANFELREAIAVTTVLKSLKTPVPPMDAMRRQPSPKSRPPLRVRNLRRYI